MVATCKRRSIGPRFHVLDDASVALEAGFGDAVLHELARRGHVVRDELAAIPVRRLRGGQADHDRCHHRRVLGRLGRAQGCCAIGF